MHTLNRKALIALMLLIAVALLSSGYALAQEAASPLSVKGTLKAVANKSKTISVAVENKGTMVFKFNDATAFVNAKGTQDIMPGDAVAVDYKPVGPDNVAIVITRAVAKLPPGVTEIKTPGLAALVAKGPKEGNYFLVDSRPAGKCSEGFIPTAVNIPVAVLEKEGEKLLPGDKNITLIFYCGGPT